MNNKLIKRDSFEIAKYSKIEYLTENDYIELMAAAAYPEHRLLMRLLWETGLRISEALGLKFSDIYPDGLNIVGKRNKQRFIPCQAVVLGELMRYRETHGDTRIFQKIKTEPGALYMMRRYADKALLNKRVHPHLFRHSFAINFLKQTGDPFSLQDILGHANMDMVKVYMRLAKQAPQDAIKKMTFPEMSGKW
jgi:integrase